jgi:hypothetical protein
LICVNRLFWSPWAGCRPSLFFLAMFHTNSIITVAGLARMSFQAGLSNVAAYFAIVRLLGPCSVGAVYKKHQQDGKGSHDDLLSLHYCVGIWRPPTIPSHVRRGNHSGLNRTGARSLWSNILCFQVVTSFQHPGRSRAAAMVDLRRLEAIHALSYWPSSSGGTAKRPNRGRRLNLTTGSKLGRH